MIYRCEKCKSTNIQVKAWIGANTNRIYEWLECAHSECWCEDCQKLSNYEGVEE